MASGVILYESSGHVVIATNLFGQKSKNQKTGKAIQIWILVKAVNPIAAAMTGEDRRVCGDCEFAGPLGKRKCYVNLGKAPMNIWKAYQRGAYQFCTDYSAFAGRDVRFGAYGEPTLIPYKIVEAISQVAHYHFGYTHQWRNPIYSAYKRYLMASCNETNYAEANAAGWRAFVVSRKHVKNLIVCPASAERGHKLTCVECGLCSGTSRHARSVQIQPHGQYANLIQ